MGSKMLWSVALGAWLMLPWRPACGDIVVGQTADLSGPASASVKELNFGAALYVDEVNRRGGVHGQRIKLVQLDDRNDPAIAPVNALALINEHKALVLFLSRGTPHTQAIVPLLREHGIGLVAPSTGAMVLRHPVNPYVFNVRASYQREAERAVEHLFGLGIKRISILQVNDTFGEDAAAGALRAFASAGASPAATERFDRETNDFAGLAGRIVAADSQAVLIIGSAAAVANATRSLRALGSRAQVVTLANNASGGFIKQLGGVAHGVVVTQVFPSERSLSVPVAKEASDLARARGVQELTPAMMEGFVSAKVLVEGLRRAGPAPTRMKLVEALRTLRRFDVGGLEIGYSPDDHGGIRYVDISIISADGRFLR